MSRDSIGNTFLVAGLLCVICSIVVSASAVGLRSRQERNKEEEKQRNILLAASIINKDGELIDKEGNVVESGQSVEIGKVFEDKISIKIIELATGEYRDDIDAQSYDQRAASKDSEQNKKIDSGDDFAGIRNREKLSAVYLVLNDDGAVDKVVLPVNGKGLWSTMYGFIALSSDLNSIRGLTFYEHGETPGLGGEIDNDEWKALWTTKKVFNADNEIAIEVIRGSVSESDPQAKYKVDGLSGATITSPRCVQHA